MKKPKISAVLRDFVFGMEDGLVSNLGLVLGVYVGGGGTFAIVLAGLASMFAGAFSMSAGSYLAAKSQREVYEQEIASTRKYLQENPASCFHQMEKILVQEGFTKPEVASILRKPLSHKHPDFVCNYLVQKKVGISKEKLDFPLKNSLMMFFSFLFGSTFPIFPFVFFPGYLAAVVAVILTIMVLFVVGWAKSLYTGRSWLKSGLEIVLIGMGAGVIGYLVGLALVYLR